MARISPFRAVRPTKDKVSLVSSRSYEDYSSAELACQLEYNPLSFLHILNPAYTNQHTEEFEKRFRQVQQKYQEFKTEEILVKDESPAFYIHRIVVDGEIFTGIISGTHIEDYKADVIKRHENTIAYRVEFFKEYLRHAGFNTEPVLVTYPDNNDISSWIDRNTKSDPCFEFSTTRKELHHLWKIDSVSEIEALQDTFSAIPNLYIGDGHHRSASAELLYDENKDEASQYFMSFMIAESNVRIYEYNRLIKDLNNLDKAAFLKRLSESFLIQIKNYQPLKPMRRHEFVMYLDGVFYMLTLKPETHDPKSALAALDVQILCNKVLDPILGIKDLRNDSRIEYLSGKHPVNDLKAKVDSGEFVLGFVLYPCTIGEIKSIADAKLTMPPKSTYIEPKFRSGLVIHELI